MSTVVSAATFVPLAGRETELAALLAELTLLVRAEPGTLAYEVHRALDPADPALLVIQRFASAEAFRAHGAHMAELGAPARLAALVDGPLARPRLFAPVPEP